jgi:copper chaperone
MLRFTVEGMNCNHCLQSVTKAVKSVDPQADVRVDLKARTLEVDTNASATAVQKAVEHAGYGAAAI